MTMPFRFGEKQERGRVEEGCDNLPCKGNRSWRMKDLCMGDDAKELVKAGPSQGPRGVPLGIVANQFSRDRVLLGFFPVGVDQDVGVDGGDHRPSIRSWRDSRSSRRTPGCS